jgi:hypothetical protein
MVRTCKISRAVYPLVMCKLRVVIPAGFWLEPFVSSETLVCICSQKRQFVSSETLMCICSQKPSAVSAGGGARHDSGRNVPRKLVDAVDAARKPCSFFAMGWCRKGAKCPRSPLSSDVEPNFGRVPYVSRCCSDGGGDFLVLRPPLDDALTAYFRTHRIPRTVVNSKHHKLNGEYVVTCELQDMEEPAISIVDGHLVSQGVNMYDVNGTYLNNKGSSTKAEVPRFFGHGTDVAAGLRIIAAGHIHPGKGICGDGAYMFGVHAPKLGSPEIEELWNRTATGGYNKSCLIVAENVGVIINGDGVAEHTPIPRGAIASKKDQYCTGRGAIRYVSITFTLQGLVQGLGVELDKLGYSRIVHTALGALTEWTQDPNAPELSHDEHRTVVNTIVSTSADSNKIALDSLKKALPPKKESGVEVAPTLRGATAGSASSAWEAAPPSSWKRHRTSEEDWWMWQGYYHDDETDEWKLRDQWWHWHGYGGSSS